MMKTADWTILLPDLFWPEPLDTEVLGEARCPTLLHLLACSQVQPQPSKQLLARGVDSDHAVLSACGCSDDTPIAPLRWWGEAGGTVPGGDYWVCVDPVQLRFHHEQIVLADASSLALTAGEAQQLVDGLSRDFSDLGVFVAPSPERWYLRLAPELTALAPAKAADAAPLSAVAGRRLHGDAVHVQSTLSQAKVRHWQNEIQMWLHAHPVNSQRREQGLAEVNGVWLWGGGALVQSPQTAVSPISSVPFNALYSTDESPLLRGIANWLNCPAPKRFDLSSLPKVSDRPVLLLVEDFISPVRYQDGEAWCAVLSKLDALLAGLLAQSQSFKLHISGGYGRLVLDSRQSHRWKNWRFWRPVPSLAEQIQRLIK